MGAAGGVVALVTALVVPSPLGWVLSVATLVLLYIAIVRGHRAAGPGPLLLGTATGFGDLVVLPLLAAFVWPLGLILAAWIERVTYLRAAGRLR